MHVILLSFGTFFLIIVCFQEWEEREGKRGREREREGERGREKERMRERDYVELGG